MSEEYTNVKRLLDVFIMADAGSGGVWDARECFVIHLVRYKRRPIGKAPRYSRPRLLFQLALLLEIRWSANNRMPWSRARYIMAFGSRKQPSAQIPRRQCQSVGTARQPGSLVGLASKLLLEPITGVIYRSILGFGPITRFGL